MTEQANDPQVQVTFAKPLQELLFDLDRATELFEAMEELGVTNRQELHDLMERLERQIDDAE